MAVGTQTLVGGLSSDALNLGNILKDNRVPNDTSSVDRIVPNWASVPRQLSDDTHEILIFEFAKPVSIGSLAFEIPKSSSGFSVSFRNRAGQEIPLNQTNLRQVEGHMAQGDPTEWHKFEFTTYPVVAQALIFEFWRETYPGADPTQLVQLYLRNFEIRRNIYVRNDALFPVDDSLDPLGNYVSKTVKEWDANKTIDGNEYTFWQSSPQPTPNAVACLYVDCRDSNGGPQLVDRLWIDPVFVNQQVNMYHSADDSYGRPRLSFDRSAETSRVNSVWTQGKGMTLSDAGGSSLSYPLFQPKAGNSMEVGLTWTYEKVATALITLVSFGNTSIAYNPSSESLEVVVEGNKAGEQKAYLSGGQTISVLASFNVSDEGTTVTLYSKVGTGQTSVNTFPTVSAVCYPTSLVLKDSQGTFSYLFVRDGINPSSTKFLDDPETFIEPDPVIEDEQGRVPESTLDMVYFAADWINNEAPRTKLDETFYMSKMWTPIWRDWVVSRGMYYFPQPVLTKYLKLEFTNLTEMPYPVWEEGIKTQYQTFPVEVTKILTDIATTVTTNKKVTTDITKVTQDTTTVNGNVTSSSLRISHNQDVNSTQNKKYTQISEAPAFEIKVGKPALSDRVPNVIEFPVQTSIRREVSNRELFRGSSSTVNTTHTSQTSSRDIVTTYQEQVPSDTYYTVKRGDCLIRIADKFNVDWRSINAANQPRLDQDRRVGMLPKRSTGWWIFPGEVIKIPGATMQYVTRTKVDTEKKQSNVATTTRIQTDISVFENVETTTTRLRFTTTSVHRYDIKTIERDVHMAYFAGIRELKVYKVNWLQAVDREEFDIQRFDSDVNESASGISENTELGTVYPTSDSGATIVTKTMPSLTRYRQVKFLPVQRQPSVIQYTTDKLKALAGSVSPTPIMVDGVSAYQVTGPFILDAPQETIPGTWKSVSGSVKIYVPDAVSGPVSISLWNGGAKKFEKLFTPSRGEWITLSTDFFPTNLTGTWYVEVRAPQKCFISRAFLRYSTMRYEISNDGGKTYFDATAVAHRSSGFFMFPQLGNQFKVRITMGRKSDYIYSLSMIPRYEIE